MIDLDTHPRSYVHAPFTAGRVHGAHDRTDPTEE